MSNIVESLKKSSDCILGIRDSIGAVKRRVSLVKRTWSGTEVGDGGATDETWEVIPQPGIKDLSHDLRILKGGAVQQGDLFITGISKNRYPDEKMIDNSSDDKAIEWFYKIGDARYKAINVVEMHITWKVQVRRLTSQEDQHGAR